MRKQLVPARTPQRPSAHGGVLGAALAGLADTMVAGHPEIPARCGSCAFRAGTVPNTMAGTLVQALNCVTGIDTAPFCCHQELDERGEPTRFCSGYMLARSAPFGAMQAAVRWAAEQLREMARAEPPAGAGSGR